MRLFVTANGDFEGSKLASVESSDDLSKIVDVAKTITQKSRLKFDFSKAQVFLLHGTGRTLVESAESLRDDDQLNVVFRRKEKNLGSNQVSREKNLLELHRDSAWFACSTSLDTNYSMKGIR